MTVALLSRAARGGTPLIDGDRATFVWYGARAPRLIGDFTHWEREPLILRRSGKRVWSRSIAFYEDAYVEYAFLDGHVRLRDTLNPRRVDNGIDATNHYFYMPKGAPTPLARPRRGVRRGTIRSLVLDASPFLASKRRRVHFYAPAAAGPWPLLVALDGDEYRRRAHLATIVDNLVAERRIRPIAIAFVPHAGEARLSEYAGNEGTVAFFRERLLPAARDVLQLQSGRGAHAIIGPSMGGFMALHAALRDPEMFGTVLSQSGAFNLGGRDIVTFALVRSARSLRVWMDVDTSSSSSPRTAGCVVHSSPPATMSDTASTTPGTTGRRGATTSGAGSRRSSEARPRSRRRA